MDQDIFPPTRKTWIQEKLDLGPEGLREVNRHVMLVYYVPLQVYFQGSSWRRLGEAQDIVHGFFVDRLRRVEFLQGWRESNSRLRRWILNGFLYFLREEWKRRRHSREEEPLSNGVAARDAALEASYDRALARQMAQLALQSTQAECETQAQHEAWRLFEEHYLKGRSYPDLGKEIGKKDTNVVAKVRKVKDRFEGAFRSLLQRDGASEERIDDEIRSMLAAIQGN